MKRILILFIVMSIFLAGCGDDDDTIDTEPQEGADMIICNVNGQEKMFPAEEGCPEADKPEEEEGKQDEVPAETSEEQQEEVSFDYLLSACNSNVDNNNISELGIKSVKWAGNDQVQIEAYISVHCTENIKNADYEIDGNTFYLSYVIDHCESTACRSCTCAKKITIVADGIKKKDYDYHLVGL